MNADDIGLSALRAGDETVFRELIHRYQHTLLAGEVAREAWISVQKPRRLAICGKRL